MKRLLETIIVLTAWLVSASLAEAITVTVAEVQNGLAVVAGNKAPKNAAITWETDSRGLTTKGGSFSFSGVVPADCVGALSIFGADTINVALANCTPVSEAPAPVPQTGQTLCYDIIEGVGVIIDCSGTGQDGELQKGVKIPTPRFQDNNNGTITDKLTGLIWLKNAGCHNSWLWQEALDFVAGINDGTYDCGDTSGKDGTHQTDWRLPNIRELQSLVDYAYLGPAISNAAGTGQGSDSDPFLNFSNWLTYWSSTTVASTDNTLSRYAWTVDFRYGNIQIFGKDQSSGNGGMTIGVRGGS